MSQEEVKIVINGAYTYLKTTLASSGLTSDKITNPRVEEMEKMESGNYKITLSYEVIGDFVFDKKKEFKDFEVQSDGTVISMKIRKV